MGKYLTFNESSLLKGKLGGLSATAEAKGKWNDCKEAKRWQAIKKYDNKWQLLAEKLSKWFGKIVIDGCTKELYDKTVKEIKKWFGHDAVDEFVSIFPSSTTAGDKGASTIEKALWKAGNKVSKKGALDISDIGGIFSE